MTVNMNMNSDKDESSSSSSSSDNQNVMEPSTTTATATTSATKKPRRSWTVILIRLLVHLFCLLVYLLPLLTHGHDNDGAYAPVLDETHIVSRENKDVSGEAPWYEALRNDYWGRPMNSASSHKSWRPLTIYTFRFLGGGNGNGNSLFFHRCFNVITHAAAAQVLAQLFSSSLSPSPNHDHDDIFLQSTLIKLVFALHPTHVEVVANAANRPHLLACLFSLLISDPTLPILWLALFELAGLTCSETFIFTMPAVLLTMTYLQRQQQRRQQSWNDTITHLLPRYVVILALTLLYITGRWVLDTLSIPDGLIRPAENPFYEFTGMRRVWSYSYVIAIHVAKSFGLDFIGFSHEYGRDCIRPVDSWEDARLLIPLGMIVGFGVVSLVIVRRSTRRLHLLALLMHTCWMATLFPISGIIKVGTFIADRIVVASTVSTSVLIGTVLTRWLQTKQNKVWKLLCCAVLFSTWWFRLHVRSLQWMDSVPLLQSSLDTCPRSSKSHLEMSKVHSGLYPELFNLTKSLQHLLHVEEIDAEFCDVHQQFAHVYIQQQEFLLFEQELLKAILCPFTMGGSLELWRRYWQLAGNTPNAQERMTNYNEILQRAVLDEQRNEAQQQQQGREEREL
jgi:hypothetical protein